MTQKKGRILTGHRPTGPRHIGHLVGTLENWAQLQDCYECFFLVADLHVLTTDYEHPEAGPREHHRELCSTGWRPGSIPTASTLVLQSAVPAHTQLSTLLGMLVTVARLNRVPTYKEQVQRAEPAAFAGPAQLPRPAGGRYPGLQSRYRAGRRRPAAAPRADARDRPPVQPALRRDLPRAAGAALGHPAPARHR